jgi:hypothetical protein
MKVKFAIVQLSTLAQRTILAVSTSTRLGQTAQDAGGGDGKEQTNRSRKTKKVQVGKSTAIENGETIDQNDSPFVPGLRALMGEDDSKI